MSTVGFVLSLSFGFVMLGVSAILGLPFLYTIYDLSENFDLSPEAMSRAQGLNEQVLSFYAMFPFIVGVGVIIRAFIMSSRSGQL